jgi:hypothetical protein
MQMPDSPVDLLMHISGRMASTFSVAIIAEDLDVKGRNIKTILKILTNG